MADDFGYLKQKQVSREGTAEMTLYAAAYDDGTFPVLEGKHAGLTNAALVAESTKNLSPKSRRNAARGKVSVADIEENRAKERELYAKHVITGWSNVRNSTGKESSFSVDNCKAFLAELPQDFFDDIADFFTNPDNFRNENLSDEEAEEVGNG